MKIKQRAVLLILIMISPFFLNYNLTIKEASAQDSPSLYVGVDVAFESIAETEELIDNISSFTNLFIIGCTGDYDETRLTIISQYCYDKGLAFIVYTDSTRYPSRQWFEYSKSKWGDSFLGVYFYDEPGGKQLDQSSYPLVTAADNYSDASNKYVSSLNWWLQSGPRAISRNFNGSNYQLFTSDYSLYWYDYEAGYDTVFAEFAQNYSRELNIFLCRGAAAVQNKDWGIMITNTYTHPPLYMESGPELYSDMVLAYENGAKYIIVFDSNLDWTQNVLQQEHLDAMKQFWQYAQTHPRVISPVSERSVYVLPEDYAYGFRSPTEDKIWGLWSNDSLTLAVSMSMAALFQIFGNNLDVVYPDNLRTFESLGYRNVIYWNDSRLISSLPSMQSPSPAQNSSPEHPSMPPNLHRDTSVLFYAIAASILFAIVVVTIVLKSKIAGSNDFPKTTCISMWLKNEVNRGRNLTAIA
jgi:hypothetical protein